MHGPFLNDYSFSLFSSCSTHLPFLKRLFHPDNNLNVNQIKCSLTSKSHFPWHNHWGVFGVFGASRAWASVNRKGTQGTSWRFQVVRRSGSNLCPIWGKSLSSCVNELLSFPLGIITSLHLLTGIQVISLCQVMHCLFVGIALVVWLKMSFILWLAKHKVERHTHLSSQHNGTCLSQSCFYWRKVESWASIVRL